MCGVCQVAENKATTLGEELKTIKAKFDSTEKKTQAQVDANEQEKLAFQEKLAELEKENARLKARLAQEEPRLGAVAEGNPLANSTTEDEDPRAAAEDAEAETESTAGRNPQSTLPAVEPAQAPGGEEVKEVNGEVNMMNLNLMARCTSDLGIVIARATGGERCNIPGEGTRPDVRFGLGQSPSRPRECTEQETASGRESQSH